MAKHMSASQTVPPRTGSAPSVASGLEIPRAWRIDAMAFATAGVTLFVQVLVHRLVSAKLLNNYAFVVIGLTMLGFGVSGAVLSRALPSALRRRREAILWASSLFVVTLLLSSAVFCRAESASDLVSTRANLVGQIAQRLPLALPFALPFAFCGLILGILLSSPDAPARRVYFFDLVGSALGAFLVVGVISAVGVEIGVLLAAGALLLGAIVLFPPRSRIAWAAAALGVAALTAGIAWRKAVFELRYPSDSMLAEAHQYGAIEHTAWDAVARVEVSRIPPPDPGDTAFPCLIGSNRAFHERFRRQLTQNNYAFTFAVDYDGRPETLRGIEETIYAAAYETTSVKSPRALAIGVGGGFDILTALHYGPAEIVGVEVNAATVRILRDTYRDYFRHWVQDPRVRLVHAEGRHYLARSLDKYDVLQLSGVDSYTGTAGAAHIFSESYLYTEQAWDLYLSRLTDQGIVNMMRLEYAVPREMLRALVTAVAALRRTGASAPEKHVIMLTATNGAFAALLVKKTPFTAEEEDRVSRWASASPYFAVSASPSRNATGANAYQAFLAAAPSGQQAFPRKYPFDITPVSDDRPFFFKYSRWRDLFTHMGAFPILEYTVLVLLVFIGGSALLCIAVPLFLFHSRGLHTPHTARHIGFFAGIGLGFMAVEMALLQKFGLFLGHPNHALSVVLAALLLSSGIGSLSCARIVPALGGLRFVSYALSGVILLEYFLILPRLEAWISWPAAARTMVVFILIGPIGILLGTFFPFALDRLKAATPQFAPWAWGINGIFSVLAPVLSVAFSTTWGMNALLLAAVPIYMATAAAFPNDSVAHGGGA